MSENSVGGKKENQIYYVLQSIKCLLTALVRQSCVKMSLRVSSVAGVRV